MFCHIEKSNIRNIMSENVGETYKMHTEVCYITDVIKLKEFKASKKNADKHCVICKAEYIT